MTEEHVLALCKLCRVCGLPFKNKIGPQGHRFSCSDRKGDLLETFSINIDADCSSLHPQSYCHPCNNIIYHTKKAKSDRGEYNPRKVIATWCEHSEDDCSVCITTQSARVGGRPRKQIYTPGRPTIIRHINLIAPHTFFSRENIVTENDCPICLEVTDRPIELKVCNSMVCLCQWLHTSQSPSCPCCHSDHLDDTDSIQPVSEITLRALGSIEVTCRLCCKRGHLRNHSAHIESKCKSAEFKHMPLASELLTRPQTLPLSPLEQRLQSTLIKRSMRNSHTLQPLTLVKVSSPRVSSGSASASTLRRRSDELHSVAQCSKESQWR